MKDTFINAKLVEWDLIRLMVFTSVQPGPIEPRLVRDGEVILKKKPNRQTSLGSVVIADFRLDEPLELGHSYFLSLPQYGSIPLDVNDVPLLPDFDEKFAYDGGDLGCSYSKEKTDFALWAPVASQVYLVYRRNPSSSFHRLAMTRTEKGVFRASVNGDLLHAEYRYRVMNSECIKETTDPYAKASTQNGRASVVWCKDDFEYGLKKEALPMFVRPSDAVIYETHVRDMTIDPNSDIVHKGRFLGMIEEGRKTSGGNPAGFDYLLGLGFTHLQLLPIYDYKTVDEEDPSKNYNWGYDPAQYFVPEGSYASDLKDPFSRIKDLQALVSAFHEKGVRIVMDVVFNHVYEYQDSVFEKVVPNYYFRKRHDGSMANTSGCGDDLASERPMVRKLILDACAWWIDVYGIDGFRFDLMGILDCETLNAIRCLALAKDPSFLVYGEGWNMGGEVRKPLGHMGNHALLPGFGFFNDYFREQGKNFFAGDLMSLGAVKFASLGSSIDFIRAPMFDSPSSSINYVECHDNATYFDVLARRRNDLDEKERLNLCLAAVSFCLFSFGVPFLHMGQEIGLSKKGEDNTYNKGDSYNAFSHATLDERKWMYDVVKAAIAIRREYPFLKEDSPSLIASAVDCSDWFGALRIRYLKTSSDRGESAFEILYNPTDTPINLPEDAPKAIAFCSLGGRSELSPRVLPSHAAYILHH